MTKQDFVLPKLGQKLIGFREEVRTGRGFQLIRSVTLEHAILPHKTLQLTTATFTAMFLMLFHAKENLSNPVSGGGSVSCVDAARQSKLGIALQGQLHLLTLLCHGYRGVPVDRYSREETIAAYWGFGLYWGKAVSQNKKGHLIGHIKVCITALQHDCTCMPEACSMIMSDVGCQSTLCLSASHMQATAQVISIPHVW